MATIQELIADTQEGFVAVATQRNTDVAALNASIAAADNKADGAVSSAIAAAEDAQAAQEAADEAAASAANKVDPDLNNAVFPVTDFAGAFSAALED